MLPPEDRAPRSDGGLQFEQRGSTWTCSHRERTKWPFLLIARRVYYGTGRLLTTLTLARTFEGAQQSISILTSHVDLLIAAQRKNFAKEAAERLGPTMEVGREGIQTPLTAMVDGLLAHLLRDQDEVEVHSAADIVIPKDLTPPYAIWPMVPTSRPGMLVAPSGTGKSSLAQMIGLSTVTGKVLLPRLDPRMQGPVLYVGQEDDKEQWAARLEMICRGHELERPRHYYYLRLKGASLIDSAPVIAELASIRHAALIIIDSAQATWGIEGDAGVRGYATAWFNAVSELRCPTLVIEHPNLINTMKGSAQVASGAGVKRDRVGHQWGMKSVAIPPRPGHPLRYHVTLTDEKRNYVAKQQDITYETLVYGFEWMRFTEADALSASTVVEAGSRLDDALAAIMREPNEEHAEGFVVAELAKRLQQEDDARVRAGLKADYWRPAPWGPGLQYRFEKTEGTGGKGHPERWYLLVQPVPESVEPVQMSMAPGDPEVEM